MKTKKPLPHGENTASHQLEVYESLDTFPAGYLARNQPEPERAAKVLTAAHERRQARHARRLKWAQSAGLQRPVFKLDLRK